MSQIQGEYPLELKFVDDRIFLNYWDSMHGNDVCVQIKDGILFKFVYTNKEVEESEVEGVEIEVFAQKELTFIRFIELVKESIKHAQKP